MNCLSQPGFYHMQAYYENTLCCHSNMEGTYNTLLFQVWMRLAGLASVTEGNRSLMSVLSLRQEFIHVVQSHSFLLEHRASPLIQKASGPLKSLLSCVLCTVCLCVCVCTCVQCDIHSPAGLSEQEILAVWCVCTVEGFGLSEPLNRVAGEVETMISLFLISQCKAG